MINNKNNFICPVCRKDLIWPEGYCDKCGKKFLLETVKNSALSPSSEFEIYDFRENDKDIQKDRADFRAHLKIIEGLFHFEDEKLKELNFSYDINKIYSQENGIKTRLKTYLTHHKAEWQNLKNLAKFILFKELSGKLKGSNSVNSSFLGYSKAYEMISSFVQPTWLGSHNGRIVLTGAIQHHYHNMKVLREIIDQWKAREVLEFGVGSGVNLLLLKKFLSGGDELKLSGFEYPVARLLTARATFNKHGLECDDLFLANGLNLPLKDNSYDIVFSHYVIEQMKGFEGQALNEMIRVARVGVVLFETALYRPTLGQRIYMKHSGYSRDLPKIVKGRKDVEILEMRNIKKSRFFGCPNVLFMLKKYDNKNNR